jgi:lipoyl(octanoyl) transferase
MNMAIDEAILLRQKSRPLPTLRFYDWSQTAFSFGYFQKISAAVNVAKCAAHGIELVRRMTGGGTVIHGWDLTYTLIVPRGTEVMPKEISAAYCRISDCLIYGFRELGVDAKRHVKRGSDVSGDSDTRPNACLANPAQHDIMLNGKKIEGVSQRRNRLGVMFQGYIALDMPPLDILALATKMPDSARVLSETSTAINREQHTPMNRAEIKRAMIMGFEQTLGVRLIDGGLTPDEVESAESLAGAKYGTEDWNLRV